MRGLLVAGVLSWLFFVTWFFRGGHIGNPFLFWALALAIGFKLIRALHEWYHYAGISVPERPESTRNWTVDMFTTFVPGEPYEMVVETLEAMVRVRYPHTTYLCDEGDDPYLKQVCQDLGVVHVYRGKVKTNAKAGNINYALQQATGEIAVVLDPDHKPVVEFLDRVLPYFEQADLGYVQSVQAYHNRDESFIAKGAAEQTYHFYGPMMMSMNAYGTVQAIGANCAFRREALDSIGGHAAGLSEDMHTAMQLHAKGWKSIYLPEALTRGQVPATLGAYYQQQLKWTRGSLDLLFHTVPKLIKHFTWRQVLHYLTLPLYFLFGLIALIDLSIPVISLLSSEVPWLVELDDLLIHSIPLLVMILIIRQFSQRWLLESHERGLHFLGGTLMMGSWWVFLIGFFYTIIGVKVPYIPTPKNDTPKNEFKISLPNIIVVLITVFSIIYGLSRDWSPYMLMMAGFAFLNVLMLSLVVLIAQQRLIGFFYRGIYGGIFNSTRVGWHYFRQNFIYRPLRSTPLAVAMTLIAVLGTLYVVQFRRVDPASLKPQSVIPSEGYYLGMASGAAASFPQAQVVTIALAPEPDNWPQTVAAARDIASQQKIPMIVWQPWQTVPGERDSAASYAHIGSGHWDLYVLPLLQELNQIGSQVFINFAPDPDLPRPSWSEQPANSPQNYQLAWQQLSLQSQNQGLYQLVWFQQMAGTPGCEAFFPAEFYVNIFGISGKESSQDTFSLPSRLAHYRSVRKKDPTWVFGVEPQRLEMKRFLNFVQQDFPAVQGVVFSEGANVEPFLAEVMNVWGNHLAPAPSKPLMASAASQHADVQKVSLVLPDPANSTSVQGVAGAYHLERRGEPLYIKGIAYNPNHDWRDGFYPLSRPVLEEDFRKVKALGANTIRRYSPSIFDYNLLQMAEKAELHVLYGFWFDPAVDYAQDRQEVAKYKREVVRRVQSLKDRNAILAWGIGNETWGLLKQHFRPSYLPQVRLAYLQMIEEIAQEVKRIDPSRPVFTALEHSDKLPLALRSMQDHAPSMDWIGVNSYYEAQISQVDSLCKVFLPDRPYMISEFGPEGYWDYRFTPHNNAYQPLEPSSYEKAQDYYGKWTKYIEPHAGANLGGIAFCWRDRMEETTTWFGLTDTKGRLRPAYVALQNAWLGTRDFSFPVPDVYLPPTQFPFAGYDLQAVYDSHTFSNPQVEWSVRESHILTPQDDKLISISPTYVWLGVAKLRPKTEYRVYVTLSDSTGTYATSASFPIPATTRLK